MDSPLSHPTIEALRDAFDDELKENEQLARYTSARIGGPADFLLVVKSIQTLTAAALRLWDLGVDFRVLGGGSNVLVADTGFRGLVLLNQARGVRFWEADEGLRIRAESGASLGSLARRAVERGWSGLEWAATIPGTVGGAVVGNAGAYGGDIASCLEMAEILHLEVGVEQWPVDRLEYAYRDSWLKQHSGRAVVLAATLRMETSSPEDAQEEMRSLMDRRQRSQPAGASMGSMFKNPPGDSAGRLIEAAGLKGLRKGEAQISSKHGNFFINLGGASAMDIWELIQIVHERVSARFGIELDLEVELLGDWEAAPANATHTVDGGMS